MGGQYWTRKGDKDDLDEKTVNPFTEIVMKSNRQYPKRRPLKVALFDLDGTLFDTEGQYSIFWGGIGEKYGFGRGFADDIKGSTLVRILGFFKPEDRADVEAGINAYEETMTYQFFPGALEFVQELKSNGIKCAIVTSSNQLKMASVAKQWPEFNTLFDKVLTSEDFTASKPAPDCYLLGAKVFGADLDECVVFEDAFNGLEAGMSSGIFTIGVASYNPEEAIRDKCNYVLKNFEGFSFEKLEEVMNIK